MTYNANVNGYKFYVPDGDTLTVTTDGLNGQLKVDSASRNGMTSYTFPSVCGNGQLYDYMGYSLNSTAKEEKMTITHVSVDGLPFDVKIDPVSNVNDALASAQNKLKVISGYKSWDLSPTGDTVYTEDRGTLPTKTVRYTDSLNNVHVTGANGKYSLIK